MSEHHNGETAAEKNAREEKDVAAERRADTIRALLEERHGYEIHGNTARVKDVDASLAAAGYKAPAGRKAPKGETA